MEPATFRFPQLQPERWETLSNAFHTKVEDLKGLLQLMSAVMTPSPTRVSMRLTHFFHQWQGTQGFISDVLPKLQELALMLPLLFPQPIQRLVAGEAREIVLTRQQAACIVVHGFFMTFEDQSTFEYAGGSWPAINFTTLFINSDQGQEGAKLECILEYFRVLDKDDDSGKIRFKRQVVNGDAVPDFENSEKPLTEWKIDSTQSIEHCPQMLQVDFANMYLGGGVIVGGCVQEEIRFAVCPELISGCLLCEVMADDEAIIILGARQYSAYQGYAISLRFGGPFKDETPLRPGTEFADIEICAIDAKDYRYERPEYQYKKDYMKREIIKAYAGFASHDQERQFVATGNWGCGAFLGDKFHKPFLQYIAASEAGRGMYYCTFKDAAQTQKLTQCVELLSKSGWKVKDLWKVIMDYERPPLGNFTDHVMKLLSEAKSASEVPQAKTETEAAPEEGQNGQ